MSTLQQTIESAWERRAELSPATAPREVHDAVAAVIAELDAGRLRVAEKRGGEWVTHQWLKKAVLLSFRLAENAPIGLAAPAAPFRFYDKVPTKFAQFDDAGLRRGRRAGRAAGGRAPRRVHRAERRADAELRQHRRLRRQRARWSTPGRPWARARRSAATCIFPAASASAGSWNRCKPTPPLSRTTASSGRAPRSSKA